MTALNDAGLTFDEIDYSIFLRVGKAMFRTRLRVIGSRMGCFLIVSSFDGSISSDLSGLTILVDSMVISEHVTVCYMLRAAILERVDVTISRIFNIFF